MAKECKAYEEADRELQEESDSRKQIYALADSYPDELPGQAKAFINMLESSKNDEMTIHDLGEDLELWNECHKQGDTFYPVLRSYWNKQDLVKIQQPAYKGKALILPSWHMAMCIYRHFPQEFGYQKASKSSSISSYSEERSVAYFSTCWQADLDFSVGLWKVLVSLVATCIKYVKNFGDSFPSGLSIKVSLEPTIFHSETPTDEREPFLHPNLHVSSH